MPRDLGQAKRADLSGRFAGETSEQVAPLVNYLITAGQLIAPGDGAPARDQRDTELATQRLASIQRRDTEVADRVRPKSADPAADTVFEPPPAKPKPPTAKLLSVEDGPELLQMETLSELAITDDGLSDDSEARTEIQKPRPIIGPPPLSPAETGLLSMEAMTLAKEEHLTSEELRADDDTHLRVGMDPAERATSKVPAQPPPKRHADGAMHDTVNFYNQTQSLKTGKKQTAPIEGTVPLKGRPVEYPPLPSKRYEPAPPLPDDSEVLLQVEPFDSDTGFRADTGIKPGNADTARRDTDRYPEESRKPPTLKLSMDTDTQKLEMQPMPALPNDEAASSDSNYDATTIRLPGAATAKPEPAPPLPVARDVAADFVPAPAASAGDRIVPEIAAERVQPQRITEKVEREPALTAKPDTRTEAAPPPMTIQELLPGRKVYDPKFSELVTKRHESARDETSALLDSAKTLALKLRQATEESRTDMLSMSARRRATVPVTPPGEGTEVERRPTRNITDEMREEGRPTAPVPMDDSVRLMSEMPTARAKRGRVPTRAIGDILSAIENKLDGEDQPLSNLLQEASRRITKQMQGTGAVLDEPVLPEMPRGIGGGDDDDGGGDDGEDIDHLVAASAALRAVIESEQESDRARGNTPTEEVPVLPATARVVAETPLAKDLDRMWKEFSIRKTGVIPKHGLTLSVSKSGNAARPQGAMWQTLAGITVAGLIVGGIFIYVLVKFFGFSLP